MKVGEQVVNSIIMTLRESALPEPKWKIISLRYGGDDHFNFWMIYVVLERLCPQSCQTIPIMIVTEYSNMKIAINGDTVDLFALSNIGPPTMAKLYLDDPTSIDTLIEIAEKLNSAVV